jgi:hypothetical protein
MERPFEAKPVKEPYEKPDVRKVKLAAGEIAAAGCKTTGGAMGPSFGACSTSHCMSVGS